MSKLTNSLNQIWYDTDGTTTKIGFTQSFLDGLDECWHIIPSSQRRLREKSPLLTVETNDCLLSILSPVNGNFLTWNDRATNFPDKLQESDVIIELTSQEVAVPPPVNHADRIRVLEGIVANSQNPMNARIQAQTELRRLQRADQRGAVPQPATSDMTFTASQWFDTTATAAINTTRRSQTATPGITGRAPAGGATPRFSFAVEEDPVRFAPLPEDPQF